MGQQKKLVSEARRGGAGKAIIHEVLLGLSNFGQLYVVFNTARDFTGVVCLETLAEPANLIPRERPGNTIQESFSSSPKELSRESQSKELY